MSRANQPMTPCVLKEPRQITVDGPVQVVDVAYSGLTIREHFAGLAMSGLCANGPLATATVNHPAGVEEVRRMLAEAAVAVADALIAELAK